MVWNQCWLPLLSPGHAGIHKLGHTTDLQPGHYFMDFTYIMEAQKHRQVNTPTQAWETGLLSPPGHGITNNHATHTYVSPLPSKPRGHWRRPPSVQAHWEPKEQHSAARAPSFSPETKACAKPSLNSPSTAKIVARGLQISVKLVFWNSSFVYKYGRKGFQNAISNSLLGLALFSS